MARCVPAAGRWLLALAHGVIHLMGYDVVYGDTDSCFIVPRARGPLACEAATANGGVQHHKCDSVIYTVQIH